MTILCLLWSFVWWRVRRRALRLDTFSWKWFVRGDDYSAFGLLLAGLAAPLDVTVLVYLLT